MFSIESFQKSYVAASLPNKKIAEHAFRATIDFFSNSLDYKNHYHYSDKIEFGYKQQPNKELFAIRNQELPPELASCVSYYEMIRMIAAECLKKIAIELKWDPSKVLNLIQKSILPNDQGVSSSLLRLIHYYPQKTDEDNLACQTHQDLGLLSIILRTNAPALEVCDYHDFSWLNVESSLEPYELIIIPGETLAALTNNIILPATHRVRATEENRFSLVYQLRADADVLINSEDFETEITGPFSKPFKLTGLEFYNREIQHRTSVNGSY